MLTTLRGRKQYLRRLYLDLNFCNFMSWPLVNDESTYSKSLKSNFLEDITYSLLTPTTVAIICVCLGVRVSVRLSVRLSAR